MRQQDLTPNTFQRSIQSGGPKIVAALTDCRAKLEDQEKKGIVDQCITVLEPVAQGGSVFLSGDLPRPDVASALLNSAKILLGVDKFQGLAALTAQTGVTFTQVGIGMALQICIQKNNPLATQIWTEYKICQTGGKSPTPSIFNILDRIQKCFSSSGESYSVALAPAVGKLNEYLQSAMNRN